MKKIIRFLLILFLLATIIIIYSRYGGTTGLITKEYHLDSTTIPSSFDGLKIVHFSDLHYLRVTNANTLKKVVDEINLINPDLVFFTGDLIDKDYQLDDKEKSELINLLSNIQSKYGKYAVLGNHDYTKEIELFTDIYTASNFNLMQNTYDIIPAKDGSKIFIGGLDSYSNNKADIDKVMEYFNTENHEDIPYKIILIHEPDYTDKVIAKYDVNLLLAGHSHNGQINIPYLKNLFLPYGSRKYYKNHYQIKDTDLYISSGIGLSKINFRLFNKPSINFYRINKITD